ncbi:MAG TPA: 6-phosphogluconolactonase [Phototrophicaceae bacterium]|nr:6-phosphogluconolactonase [Phototrophicaceae bacterium]
MTGKHNRIRVEADAEHLAQAAADLVVETAQAAIAHSGRFTLALAGGSTPRRLYERLAAEPYVSKIIWPHVHLFWGDERCVPPDHPDSNYRMARESLLEHILIPGENIHRIQGELAPPEAAALYEQHLRTFFGNEPRFDLILLGMGADGHTASLFPHTPALQERERWVVPNYALSQQSWRITLTIPVINAAAHIIFLVAGAKKAETLHRVLTGPYLPDELPAQQVQPAQGDVLWLIDKAAARRLNRP